VSESAANDLLMGGSKAYKFENLGDTVIGTIIDEPKVVQMTKHGTTDLDFWPSGDPKMQIVVTIQTDLREAGNAADDGKRRLYIPPRMMGPVREAIQRTGAKGLAIGGRIAVRWYAGSGQGEGNARQYQADYAAPAVDPGSLLPAAAAPLSAAQPTVQAAPLSAAPVAQPVVQAAPVAAAPVATTATTSPTLLSMSSTSAANAPAPNGVDPAVWAAMPEAHRQAVLNALVDPAASAPAF
jgi:hypothetical protein